MSKRWLLPALVLLAVPAFVWWAELGSTPRSGAKPQHINTLFDAAWWMFASITTVGYGDRVPMSPEGYGVGVLAMFVGAGLFVLATSTLTHWLLEKSNQANEASLMLDGLPLDEALEQYDADGWELIGIRLNAYYFKRPKITGSSEAPTASSRPPPE